MGIYVDGERSRQRLGFAKSMLNKLKMLGMSSKRLSYEGFDYRADVIAPGLTKIMVTAPIGAVVVCSQSSGMQVLTADYWLTGFTPARDVYVVDNAVPSGTDYTTISANAELPRAKFVPRVTASPTSYPTYTEYNDHVPTPGVYSFPSEAFWLTVSASPASSALRLVESSLTFYTQSGDTPKRISMFCEGQISSIGFQVTQAVPSESVSLVSHSLGGYRFNSVSNDLICATAFSGLPSGMQIGEFPGWVMFYGAPAGLQDLLLTYTTTYVMAIGSFAFATSADSPPTLLHCVDATASAFDTYFGGNPTMKPWKLFYSMYELGSESITTYTVDTALLELLAPGVAPAGVVDWTAARNMMWQLFPWPNNNYNVPPDSAMFYSDSGKVYTWTRKYGAVRFDSTGMSIVTLVMPDAVTDNDGVRPEIYHTGAGQYICSAFKPNHMTDPVTEGDVVGVVGLYVGSPFSEWEALPMPEGVRLLQVRISSASATEIVVLGVVLVEGEYNFAMLRRKFADGGWSGDWKIMAKLDVTVADPDTTTWGIGTFGTVKPNRYLAPPPALPQMPAIPYSAYAATIP